MGSCIVDPEDVALADAAFERTHRRRAGENIDVTEADLTGTLCLIHQLIQGLDYKLLIDVLSNSVTEEYGGPVPEELFTEFERIIRKTMIASDLETQPVGDPIS